MIQLISPKKAKKVEEFQRSIAVVIGINEYQNNSIHNLKTAKYDARKLADIVETQHLYDEVILINDDTYLQPTHQNLFNLLQERLPKEIKPTKADRLLFYYAGHGIARESDRGPAGFLLPQDADLENNKNLLSMQKLYELLKALACRHVLVILDCCFAGTLRWSSRRLATVIPKLIYKEHYDHYIASPAWQAITSAAHNQEALDSTRFDNRGTLESTNHSPFAQALFQALEGEGDVIPPPKNGQPAGDGVITVNELYSYLRHYVAEISHQRQLPGIWTFEEHSSGEYIFLVPGAEKKLKPAPPVDEKNNPYRGLNPFEEEHAKLFFGREELVKQLYERISSNDESKSQLTVVVGTSGSGKSSLVKAGLIPYLRQQNSPGWHILKLMRPSANPFTALAKTILPITTNITISNQLEKLNFISDILQIKIRKLTKQINEYEQETHELSDLESEANKFKNLADTWKREPPEKKQLLVVEHFDELNALCRNDDERNYLKQEVLDCLNPLSQHLQNPDEFINIVKNWSQKNRGVRLLLVIDQLEELITLSRNSQEDKQNQQPNESQQFLTLLEKTLAATLPQLSIVVTLRSDFEPRFLTSEALKSHWTQGRFPVRGMYLDELRQAIERPAAEMALYFEQPEGQRHPVDRLIDEVGQMPGALPLLSFTLSELYIKLAEKWKPPGATDRTLKLDTDFDKQGGVAGSLTRRANDEYDKLDDAQKATMRRVMLRMLTLEGGETARRRVQLSELVYTDKLENQRVQEVIDRLINARLIVSGQETGEPYIEPAHDLLVRGWDKLQQWQQEEQENLPLQRRLTPVALEWKNKEQPPSLLGKAEPVLDYWDKKIDSAQDWLNNRKKKDVPQRPREKKRQFLWNGNPYLDVLRNRLKSLDYWFNQIETEFVQQSAWQRRRNVNLRWGIATAVIVGLSWLTFWALMEQRKAVIGDVYTARESAETDLRTNQLTLDALAKSLRAGKARQHWLLQAFPPQDVQQYQLLLTLLKAVYTVREHRRWEIPTGLSVADMFVSLDGKVLVAGTTDNGTVCIWDFESQQCNELPATQDPVETIKFSRDASRVAIATKNGTVQLWNWQTKQIDNQLFGLQGSVRQLSFSPNGQQLVLTTRDENIQRTDYLWDLQNRQSYLVPQNQGNIVGINFHSNGELLVAVASTTGENYSVRLWNYSTGKDMGACTAQLAVDEAIISPNGDRMFIIQGSARTGGGSSFLCDPSVNNSRPMGKDMRVSFHPQGEQLATSGSDGTIRLWDSFGFQQAELKGHQGEVDLSFSSDGKYLLTRGSDSTIRLWDTQPSQQISQPQQLPAPVNSLSVDPDSQLLATLEAGKVRLRDISTGELSATLPDKYNPESKLMFLPKSKQLAIAQENAIDLWDVSSHRKLQTFPGSYNLDSLMSFSPDGKQLAILDDDVVNVLDLSTQKKRKVGSQRVTTKKLIWRFDGTLLKVTGSEGDPGAVTVNVREVSSDKIVASVVVGTDYIRNLTDISLNKDNSLVAIAKSDGTVKLLDLQSRQLVEFSSGVGEVKSLSLSPDGSTLAVVGENGTTKLWRLGGYDELFVKGCDRLYNYLTSLDETNINRHLCD